MKSEFKLFGLSAGFLFLCAAVYGWWTWYNSNPHQTEWIGLVALILSGLLCSMCGGYFWFVARRIELRPEDRGEAEIVDGAGEVGFFSPGSYWPVALAGAAGVAALATAFWQVWLLVVGIVLVLLAVGGLVFEYHIGPNRD